MKPSVIRNQLHKLIDQMPDDLVGQVSDFSLFLLAKWKAALEDEARAERQWQTFSLEQFFREDDEVTYSLQDTKNV